MVKRVVSAIVTQINQKFDVQVYHDRWVTKSSAPLHILSNEKGGTVCHPDPDGRECKL
jgi:hypothetical protein